jgi:gliding motility-associated-like protein
LLHKSSFAIFLFLFFSSFSIRAYSQNHQWSFNLGLSNDDLGHSIYTDNKGFVYVVGFFAGTNVDFDPSTSNTAYLSSKNGSKDGFVAKYTTDGKYIWAFNIGGSDLDDVGAISVDAQGNVYITGYFRGQGVDFNPSTAGIALLNSNGEDGGDPGYGGDIFIAKYNSSGQYQWAFNIGGESLGDNGTVIVTDDVGNIYTGGYFNRSADFDPSTSVSTLDASNGVVYFAKYNTAGQYQWAFNVGQPNGNSHPFGLKIDALANIYVTGYIIGSDLDFDPSPTTTNSLSSNGIHDIFLAKYNSEGQYQWATAIGGSGSDVARDLDVDSLGNIYLSGDFQGEVDFDPSPSTAMLTSIGGSDIFIARYDSDGQYQWAKRFGSNSNDIAWSVAYTANNVYITGGFEGVVNFSPGPIADNIISNGTRDIYLTKFDVNGNYVCAFSIGGVGVDESGRIDADRIGNLYLTGVLSSNNVDFNPGGGTNTLSTKGGGDVFVAKYNWPDNPRPTGGLSGNTICNTQQGQLTFTATSGIAPFTIEYSDGTTTFTKTNVQPGVPFDLDQNPTTTTTYNLISIKDATKCAATNNVTGITAVVNVSSGALDFNYAQSSCNPKVVDFSTLTGAISYNWNFGDATTATSPAFTKTYSGYGTYLVKLKVLRGTGCVDSVAKQISILTDYDNTLIAEKDSSVCSGNSLQLNASEGGLSFCWFPTAGLSNSNTLHPTAKPAISTTYYFTSQVTQNNLVVNGDFSQGNSAFSSDYQSAFPNTAGAQYFIANDPKSWNTNFNSCTEHTTGNGNMMMINGSSIAGKKAWSQSVAVTPNTNYAFSVWIQSLAALNPASLKFVINGFALGNDINAGVTACEWKNIFATWNSGNSSNAVISIINNNTVADGNDFAIDDITFSQVFIKQDSVRINVSPSPIIKTIPDTSVCEGVAVSLKTTGGTFYNWVPAAGLSNTTLQSPVVTPMVSTSYIVSAYNTPGCTGKDTVNINILPKPAISLTKDTSICSGVPLQLLAGGGANYKWTPSTGLNSSTISNPVSTTLNNLTYTVTAFSSAGCTNQDSVKVQVAARPIVTTIKDTSVCNGVILALTTSVTGATSVSWSPTTGLSNANTTSPMAAPSATTEYFVTANNNGCITQDSVNLQILSPPAVSLTNDTILCSGTKLQLVASGGTDYKWSPSAGLTADNVNDPVASPASSTIYYVDVKGLNGCTKKDSVLVSVAPKPTVSTIANTTVCDGTPVTLVTTSSNVSKYNWFPATGLSSSTIANPIARPSTTTAYVVTVSTEQNCEAKDTVQLTVSSLPVVNKTSDTTVCSRVAIQLFVTGGVTYDWFPTYGLSNSNVSNPVFASDSSILYKVLVTGANGCSKTDSVNLSVRSLPAFNIFPTTARVCENDAITITASGGNSYEWLNTLVLSPSAASMIVKPIASTTYKVRIHDTVCNLTDTLSSFIAVNALPKVVLSKSNDIDCSSPFARLTASGAANYVWSPSVGLSSPNIANPVASPTSTTYYTVKGIDAKGCSKSDSIQVLVKFTANTNSFDLPNAFTPNGDGKNDCFGVKYWGTVSGLELSIFNRWGERVFYTTNPSECWDGRYKSIPQNSGAFVYLVKAKTVCAGEITRKGTVVLIR